MFVLDSLILDTPIHKAAMIKLKEVVLKARQGNELPFNKFLEETFTQLKKQLISLTLSESKAEDVFIMAMQKFWERFVIQENELPKNPPGYIYMMCKNICRMEKRGHWNRIVLKDSFSDQEVGSIHPIELDEDEVVLKQKALEKAMNVISNKCKRLMELSMDSSIKLADCLELLGFKTYQALIQAKYNCKKKLIKEVFLAL